jgi:hypothetical protein
MRLAIAYKNFAANRNISHIGLGVSAMNTVKSLRRAGIPAEVWPVVDVHDLRMRLERAPQVTHAVISAPWIPTADLQRLTTDYLEIQFAVNCHSNVGFLQADSNGVRLFGEGLEIERGSHNFRMAGNSRKFTNWVQAAFGVPCAYLPNLYYLDDHVPTHLPVFGGGILRIGAFGATRVLKNLMSAAGAAMAISRDFDVDLELWINSGREEGGSGAIRAIKEMYALTRNARVVEAGWQSWHNHRKNVRMMDLLISCSYTESFSMVTADGVAEGVASAVSDVIDWTPLHWRAKGDDVLDIARVGRCLLRDPNTGVDGLRALTQHNREGLTQWSAFLGVSPGDGVRHPGNPPPMNN